MLISPDWVIRLYSPVLLIGAACLIGSYRLLTDFIGCMTDVG
jgi:hypothetical protein